MKIFQANELSVQPMTTWRGEDYGFRYFGTEQTLLQHGIVDEQWIPGRLGRNRFSITIGKGEHRIAVRRISKRTLEVRKYHPRIRRLDPARARPAGLRLVSSQVNTALGSARIVARPALRLIQPLLQQPKSRHRSPIVVC